MKRIFICLVAVFTLFLCSSILFAEEETTRAISGYQTGEFAYKGEVEKIGNDIIAEIKKISEDGENIMVRIEGFADTVGKTAVNDELARLRAEALAEEFRYQLPKAKISAVSKGDLQNVREVHVSFYKVVLPVVSQVALTTEAEEKKPQSLINIRSVAVASTVLISILLPAIFLFLNRNRVKIVVDLEFQDKKYKFYPVITKDRKMQSLYKNKAGNFLAFSIPEELIRSVKSTLNREPELVSRLIEEGRLVLV